MGMISILAILMIIASFLVFSLRNLKFATYAHIVETLLLVGIFFTLAEKYHVNSLYGWAVITFFTKVLIIPYVILRLINKLGVKSEEIPAEGFFISPVIALGFSLAIAIILFPVLKSFALLKENIPLIASLTIFSLGIFGLILKKNTIKQILSLCLFENGTYLILAFVAYNTPKIVDVGILTDSILAIIIILILATRFYKFFSFLDIFKKTNIFKK